jgi:transposase
VLRSCGHGSESRIGEPVKEQPDRTLAELGEQLRSSGVEVGRSRISQVLWSLGLRLKKVHLGVPSENGQ